MYRPPCDARRMLRAYADPCILRPLRKLQAFFFCHRQRKLAIPHWWPADMIRFPHPLQKKDRREAVLFLERMRGIEPPLSAWEAGVLPMNYIRVYGKYSTERKKNQSLFRRIFSSGSAEEQRQDKIVLSMVRRANAPLIFTTSSTIFNHRTVAGSY